MNSLGSSIAFGGEGCGRGSGGMAREEPSFCCKRQCRAMPCGARRGRKTAWGGVPITGAKSFVATRA